MTDISIKKTFTNPKVLENIFLSTGNDWRSTESKSLSVKESGKDLVLLKTIVNMVKKAERMICLQSFLIQDTEIITAMKEAVEKRNVRVFVMDSAESRLDRKFEEADDYIAKDYTNMLESKFKNNFVHRQASNLHAKFILIDPTTKPKGFLFTGNFNEKPFKENPELAVPLDNVQVNELFQLFVYHFWEYATDEQTKGKTFIKVKPANKFKLPELKSGKIFCTSPRKELCNLSKELIREINNAKNNIIFSTFGFDVNHEVSQAILEKLKSGISVTIFCRQRQKCIQGHLGNLLAEGARIFCHPLIHAKSLVVDGNAGYIFTANFEKHGMDSSFEVGAKLNSTQVADLLGIYQNWENTFPYKMAHKMPLKDIDTFSILNREGRLEEKKIKSLESKSENRNMKKASDFINAVKGFQAPKHFNSQKIEMEKILKFKNPNFEAKSTNKINSQISLVQYEITPNQKKPDERIEKKAILAKGNLEEYQGMVDILSQKEFINLPIYYEA